MPVASISIATTWKTIIHENALSELKTPLLEQMMNGIELTSAVTNDRIYLMLIGKISPWVRNGEIKFMAKDY